jgi:hypothetical protein
MLLITASYVTQSISQSPSSIQFQAIQMIPEPAVSMGTFNRVFTEKQFGQKTFLFKQLSATEWDTLASPGDPNQFFQDVFSLTDGVTYQYQVLFNTELSNIVSSTQDDSPPIVTIQFDGDFANTSNIRLNYLAVDSVAKSIKKSILYYRPNHEGTGNWREFGSKDHMPAVAASPGSPHLDSLFFQVPDSLGDGPYEFLIVAQDTAWSPLHRPDTSFTGEEGNIIVVNAATPALKQLFVDTNLPSSQITSQLDQFLNTIAVQIQYHAEDLFLGHNGFRGSGVNKVSLYFNYKVDPGGAYLFTDSLFQSTSFATPLLEVDGAFNFVASKDGYYEFYTLASDTALNTENDGAPKTFDLSFVVDSSAPKVDSILVIEDPDMNVPAPQPGWTKKTHIRYDILGASDVPKDGYASDLDSIFLAENIDFTLNDSSFAFAPQALSGQYRISSSPGTKDIFGKVVDKAANSSFPVSRTIIFDPNPPLLNAFSIPFSKTAADTVPVSIDVEDDFVLDSLYIWRNSELLHQIALPDSNKFTAVMTLDLLETKGDYFFSAQVRDKAGNLSEVISDTVKLVDVVSLQEFSLHDLTDPQDAFFGALPGYSDSMTVSVRLKFSKNLRKLDLSEDSSFLTTTELLPPWNVVDATDSDTTIQFEYMFAGDDGSKQLFVRGIGPLEPDTSNVLDDSIIVDTTDPVFEEISTYRAIGLNDTTFAYTNSRDIRVRLRTPDVQLNKIVIWETGLDSILYESFSSDTTYSLRTLDDGQIGLNAGIRDLAGNWSPIQSADVFLDRLTPRLDLLSFDHPFSSTFDVNINYSARDDTTFSKAVLLDRIRFSEDSQFPDENTDVRSLPAEASTSGSFLINLEQVLGQHTVFAQVRDKAGNWGNVLSAQITVVEIVQPTSLVLEDITPQMETDDVAFSGWSNSDTVRATVTFDGILKRIVAARNAAFTDGVQDFDEWTNINGTTVSFLYDFGDASGLTELYVKLIGPNLPDTSAVIQAAIRVDKERPTLAGITLFQVLSAEETLFDFSSSSSVRVRFDQQSEEMTHAYLWEEFGDSLFISPFLAETGYTFSTEDNETKTVFATARDSAGNWSIAYDDSIILDTRPPRLEALSFDAPFSSIFEVGINYSAQDDTASTGVGLLDSIRFSEDSQFLDTAAIQGFTLPGGVSASGSFQITLEQVLGGHTVFSQVRDKAGNWGNVLSAQITVVEIVQPTSLFLEDITPQMDTDDVAFSGWSNSDTVRAIVTFDGVLKRIVAAKNATFTDGPQDFDEWTTINDSTVSFLYDFGDATGLTELYVKLIGPNLPDTSAVIQAAILVDKERPTLAGITLFQVLSAEDTLFDFSSSRSVRVRFDQQSEEMTHAYLWEESSDSVLISPFFAETGYTFGTEDNETKTVFATVRDSAGNWSAAHNDSMVLDTGDPAISDFIISDISTPGNSDSTLTNETRVEITFAANDVLPGKLFRVRIAQDSNFMNNVASFVFSADAVIQQNGIFTLFYDSRREFFVGNALACWAVVEDSALNQSTVIQDEILFTEELRIKATLYDAADPGDSLFSSSNEVTLEVREVSGIYEEVAYSESPDNLNNWTRVTTGQPFVVSHTFGSSESFFVGRLFVAARNSASDSIASASASITVDQIQPDLFSTTIRAVSPPGSEDYTNSTAVSVEVCARDSGLLKEIQMSLDSTFSTFSTTDISSDMTGDTCISVPFEITTDNGLKTIYARIVDFAENIGQVMSDQIIADFDPIKEVSNFPNPFNPNLEPTTLVVKSDGNLRIEVKIYDLFGNLVREFDVPSGAIYNQIEWDGRNGKREIVANGGYICIVRVGNEVRKRKIAVLK